ncbi:periplasmic heavy metal sensor [Roseinatronobacter alkalisoli]|uniref:Periplasmic heavy metal sensor n=1 Tax=Roseinatronobacter alkalisoli TaxID=3028235 RepID=A0ABT5T3M3_9RHOB|nr:periplasmic heavy metal sensor [Roseinatronobacter sp. HJB301]MDD7969576.1 periplasmic heavy metal sensor [Roseinatronobacter sp. HJB301]
MAQPDPKPRMPVWGKIVLTISLILNLAFIGLIGGVAARAGLDGTPLRTAISALPFSDQRAFRRDSRNAWRDSHQQPRSPHATQQMIASLQADEFDEAQFTAALIEAQQHLINISNRMQSRLVARVAAMTPQERHDYAAQLQQRIENRRGPGWWRSRQRE